MTVKRQHREQKGLVEKKMRRGKLKKNTKASV